MNVEMRNEDLKQRKHHTVFCSIIEYHFIIVEMVFSALEKLYCILNEWADCHMYHSLQLCVSIFEQNNYKFYRTVGTNKLSYPPETTA
jgi:hypothetical protein